MLNIMSIFLNWQLIKCQLFLSKKILWLEGFKWRKSKWYNSDMIGYIITLVVLLLVYCIYISIYIFNQKLSSILNKRPTLNNAIFLLISFSCYIAVVVISLVKNGVHDWNFQNTLPTANVSPLIFATLPIYFILTKKAKDFYLRLISLLSVGMIISPVLSIAFNIYRGYSFFFQFLFDYVAHISLAMWGVYIIKSNQVKINFNKSMLCIAFMFAVALTMLILNLIFKTTFFGLNLYGNHNIYNMRIVENSYVSCLLYFVGLFLVMLIGHLYLKLLNKKIH